jgi:hypothetical protein
MERAFAAHNDSAEEPIRVRIGLNAGEPIAEDEDLLGTAVHGAEIRQSRAGPVVAGVKRACAVGRLMVWQRPFP